MGNAMGAEIAAKTPRGRKQVQPGKPPASSLSRKWSVAKDQTVVAELEHLQSVAERHMVNLSQIQSQADTLAAKSQQQSDEIELLKKSSKRIELKSHSRTLPMSNVLLPLPSNSSILPLPSNSPIPMPSRDQQLQSHFTRRNNKNQPLAPLSSSSAGFTTPESSSQQQAHRGSQMTTPRRLPADDRPLERVHTQSPAKVRWRRLSTLRGDQRLASGKSEAQKLRSKSEGSKLGAVVRSLRSIATPPLNRGRNQPLLGTLAGRFTEEAASEDEIASQDKIANEAKQTAWQSSEVAVPGKFASTISSITPYVGGPSVNHGGRIIALLNCRTGSSVDFAHSCNQTSKHRS